jgi:hypothetical protein
MVFAQVTGSPESTPIFLNKSKQHRFGKKKK